MCVAISLLSSGTTLLATVGRFASDATGTLLVTTATGHGASAPGLPLVHDAVDGALVRVAAATLLEGTTGLAAVLGFTSDLASAGVSATAAKFAAGDPLSPGGYCAMNGAVLGEAFLLLGESGANVATVFGVSADLACTLLDALAAGFAALGPSSPFGDEAVDGAGTHVAVALFGEDLALASLAAVLGESLDLAVADLEAKAAVLGALAPNGVGTELAVDGAGGGAAGGSLTEGRALLADLVGLADDLTDAESASSAAGLGAFGVGTEGADLAVDGAGLSVALASLLDGGAFVTTIGGLNNDLATTVLDTSAALLGAGTPDRPGGHLAVSGASFHVAKRFLDEVGAFVTVELGEPFDHALALTDTAAAASSALAPSGPGVDLAVEGALLGVALLAGLESGALVATKLGVDNDITSTSTVAGAALGVASVVLGPGRNLAVDLALESVALGVFGHVGAFVAVEGRAGEHFALAEFFTVATFGIAGRPGAVCRHGAVFGAISLGALASFLESGAIVGRLEDGALAGLFADAAGLGAGGPLGPHSDVALGLEVYVLGSLAGDDLGATSVDGRVVAGGAGVASGELGVFLEGADLVELVFSESVAKGRVAADALVLGGRELVAVLGTSNVELAAANSEAAVLRLPGLDYVNTHVSVVRGDESTLVLVEFSSGKKLPAASGVSFGIEETEFDGNLRLGDEDVDTRVVIVGATSLGSELLRSLESGGLEELKLVVSVTSGGVAPHLAVRTSGELETVLGTRNLELEATLDGNAAVGRDPRFEHRDTFLGIVLGYEIVLVHLEIALAHKSPLSTRGYLVIEDGESDTGRDLSFVEVEFDEDAGV